MGWNHPSKLESSLRKILSYELHYGIGVRVNGLEQFRKIYSGRAHKCIITDLIPKTNYRFRVRSVKINKEINEADL